MPVRENVLRDQEVLRNPQQPIEQPFTQYDPEQDQELRENRYEFYYYMNLATFSLMTILFSFIFLSLEVASVWSISGAILISLAFLQASRYVRNYYKDRSKVR
ncbi:DUF3270 family protein [Streptococcus danieliae]|uniref:DUF3270 family protein n=1 Tax=Streptococcus danieliae TaxID=747656 RepID=A0A7Z0RQP3_9STRE|nr:DUF3270 family protein [Streptococcus danieliae]MBF0717291.1 DUF3270 family protein [Streptococcus danieliae]MCU0081681.1 DUF3270 domain-containing protein [Streptococcus danieliae]MVX59111.1 DUF3270 family protein [Streptococcus danieliae]NYS33481.1 DUF3270 family protein [Streptococcus danieliae]NYS49221.1 DUF3270 family protein [Streptococcus danieliae]